MKDSELKEKMNDLFWELFGDPTWCAVDVYRLRDLGKWDACDRCATFIPKQTISFRELKAISAMIMSDRRGYDTTADFVHPCIRKWYNALVKINRRKNNPVLCGAILAVWERVPMTVDTDGRITLDGEPDYCPLFAPARDLWKIMKGEKQMSEVKVTIEWNGNTAGLHPDPMKVHFAGDADPNKIIGAVTEAMGYQKATPKDDEFTCMDQQGDKIIVTRPDGKKRSFPTWREAVDYIVKTADDDV